MKIIYVTDLHGSRWKYERLLKRAENHKVDAVINGGDVMPMGAGLHNQGQFIFGFLDNYFSRFNSKEIYYLSCPGNDDLKIFDELYDETCDKYHFVKNLAQRKLEIRGYEFIGMNWVVDYPFRLKDRCRMDTQYFEFPEQYGKGVLSFSGGLKNIHDWFSYARTLPTIEEELDQLVRPDNMRKCIYIIHMPQSGLDLDVCSSGLKVGSRALYKFLLKNQPLFSLHGHIHESPVMSGKWYSKLGDTICIQPGQLDDFAYVLIDLSTMEFQRYTERY
jgi:Icc-related predicted phosphoesterase